MPCPIPNCSFRIAGIQSRTTHPAIAGSVKHATNNKKGPLVSNSRETARIDARGSSDLLAECSIATARGASRNENASGIA